MSGAAARYKNHRFLPEIIARAVWLYCRFPLSLGHVEEMLLERGIVVSYETIRRWGRKHGPEYVRGIRRKQPSSNDVWHLDEVVITDKLRSYGTARRQVMPNVEHRSHKGLNNRAENSHLPFRKRERVRQGFRPIGSLQHFVSVFSAVRNLFVPSPTNRSASQIRKRRLQALAE